jgi:sterol desaturase/sphingolipid hydroxylase (fatty acid hydroxylase superfamily)
MGGYLSVRFLNPLVLPWLSLLTLVLIARRLEKVSPIDPHPSPGERRMDYKFAMANTLLGQLMGPLTGACSGLLVNAAGGGWIPLRMDGGWSIVSTVVVVLFYDLYRYWNHRLYHMVPALWAMHSFHHSAEALTVVTGARHYWLETAIDAAFFPVVAILFRLPPAIGSIILLVYFLPDGCSHLNYRINLGRFVTWLNNPQWHRIHHSVHPEHLNKNFCSLLPLMDMIFGTAWLPAPDEYPVTGLTPRERPGLWEGLVWPIRGWLFRRPANTGRAATAR